MRRILKREAAKRDLIEQWVWYTEKGGVGLADRFLEAESDSQKGSQAVHSAGVVRASPSQSFMACAASLSAAASKEFCCSPSPWR
jgi:hypothetical protein